MTSLDLRVGALSLLGNPGTSRTLRLVFTADGEPVEPGPVSVWIGGDERSPSDFDGAVEHPAVVAGNEATVTVPIPDSRELLRVTLDSALATIGTVAPSLRGTPDQDQTVQVNLGAVEVHVTSLVGTDVDPVEVVTDPAALAALSATFAPLLPMLRARVDRPLSTVHARADQELRITVAKDEGTGRLYGVRSDNTRFCWSDDGITWTDHPTAAAFTYFSNTMQAMYFTAGWMYVTTSDGRIFRSPKADFTGWTNISAPVPVGTTGRPGIFAATDDGLLLYAPYGGTIGAGVFRSEDNGDTWTNPLWLPPPQARHSHSVRLDPWHPGHAYFIAGDENSATDYHQGGLYKSTDWGETWDPVYLIADRRAAGLTVGRIGIDMVFPEPVPGLPEMVIMEGDVTGNGAHLYVHYKGTDTVEPLIWYSGALGTAETTVATTRGICLTPLGDCIYFTTTEGGAAGVKAGIYVAPAPLFDRSVLLEDITGAEPVGYRQTVCSPTQVHQGTWRFNMPVFAT